MKFRRIEYFVAAAEELNFTHAADRLHVSQPPFSKQIHELEDELGIELFQRQRKGVALTPAGKSFLIDARQILEDCEASIRKAQRISRRRAAFVPSGNKLHVWRGRRRAATWSLTESSLVILKQHSNPNLRAPPFPNYVATPSQNLYLFPHPGGILLEDIFFLVTG